MGTPRVGAAERQVIASAKETGQLHDKPGDTVKPDGMAAADEALYPQVKWQRSFSGN